MKTDKLKYTFAFILLLCAFLCGVNFKRWHTANHRMEKLISLVYSSSLQCANENFEELLKQEFRRQGVEPVFEKFYLDFNTVTQEEGIKNLETYLERTKDRPMALILSVGDQAMSALFSTRHRLLSSIPIVACNVHFPDEKLIKEYERKKVYVLRDVPDFKRNIDFIKSLQPHTELDIIYNIDLTPLGYKSFDLLTRFADRKDIRLLGSETGFSSKHEYKQLQKMVEDYNLMPARANNHMSKDKVVVSLCPFRYTKGTSLLVEMEKTKNKQVREVFLLDKFDQMSLPITKALNIPSFSCIREGFGGDAKIVGGYMATEEISARTVADFSVRLMNKEKIGMPKIRDMEKEYVLDWTYFSAYEGFDVKNVPENVRIINYSFYDRYQKGLYFLTGLFVLAFILILVSLLRMRRRSHAERKNMEILEDIHKRLALSMDGGRVALWNMRGDNIEFDENYTRSVGMKQRTFVRADFLKYTYPDDVPLLSSLYETLHQSTNMQVRRVRFSFNEEPYRWYELRCRSLKDAKGEIMLAGVMQDIQKQVERENQLIQAKQMAENAELKQSFLNNMSHEIRTPLNAIVGFTNLLVGEGGEEIEPEEKKIMLELINLNNELLLKLVNDVVEMSRLDSGNMDLEIKEWDMTVVVKEIYIAYRPLIQPSLEFCLELDETLSLPVNMDRMRFIQVISNFLSNANKFTQDGSVTLGCKVDKEQQSVSVYVEDTGKGIGDKELMMIFDRFYKTDEFEQGSGLGLSICKVIIEKLCGRIEVWSEVGKGSRFTVILSLENVV